MAPSRTATALGDETLLDAFGRLRVSSPETLFDSQSQYDVGSLLWENKVSGGAAAAHSAARSSVMLSVTTASGDRAIRQTRAYHRYQPGKSQLVLATFVLATGQTGTTQYVGYGDDDNGIFLREQAGSLAFVRRTKVSGVVVEEVVEQDDWSIERFDGSDFSGLSLDATKAQILFIDMEWLGVGRVRVGFVIEGQFYVAHEFSHANEISSVYMTTANLPIRYEIVNAAEVAGAKSLEAICASVISEGGFEVGRGIPFGASNSGTLRNITTTPIPLLSIRPKATFNSIVNRGQIIPSNWGVYCGAVGVEVALVYGGTLTSASFGSVSDSSIAEYDVAATAISGGIAIARTYVPASNQSQGATVNQLLSRLPLSLDIAGANPINLSVVATRIGGTGTATAGAALNWQEIR